MKRLGIIVLLLASGWAVGQGINPGLQAYINSRVSIPDDFVSTWRTTADAETITVPTRSGYAYDCTVDWGDGTVETLSGYDDAKWTHEYATAGDYDVTISGTFETIYFNRGGDRLKLIAIPNLGSVGWKSLHEAFWGCENLLSVAGGDTSEVVSFRAALDNCYDLETVDTSGWDTSSVETFLVSFKRCWSLTSYMPPDKFWDRVPAVPEHRECFYDATNIENYADIPADWK